MIIISAILIIFFLPLILLLISFYLKYQNELYFQYVNQKLDNLTSTEQISFIIADEIRKKTVADFVAVIEYTYSGINVLACMPDKYSYNNYSSHETFLILKNLLQSQFEVITNNDIQSEHFKTYIPIFNYKNFRIIPVYIDKNKIVTIELYYNTHNIADIKINSIRNLLNLFEKKYSQISKLKNTLLKANNNETIIRFLDRIRNTIDENELEQIILEESARAFGADRTAIVNISKSAPEVLILKKEYLSNPYIKSLRGNGLDFNAVTNQIKELNINPPLFVIENSERFIVNNKFENTPVEIFINKSQIKSSYPFLIYETEENLSYLIIQYTHDVYLFNREEFEMFELITKQSQIALSQAKYYSKMARISKKEKLLIGIISLLHGQIELKKVANEFAVKLGMYFNAQRCIIRFYDSKINEFSENLNAFEYKENYDISGTKDFNLDKELREFLLYNEKFHNTMVIQYSKVFEEKEYKFRDILLEYAQKHKIRSYILAFIRHNSNFYGILSLHFNEEHDFAKEDEEFLKALSDQLGIAIYQAELYYDIQNVAKKEKFLKEIFSESLGLQNKKQIYKYFGEKILQLFSPTGVVFVEFPDNPNEKIEYYEHYEKSYFNLNNFKNFKNITDIINKKILSYNCNIDTEHSTEEYEYFLEENKLKSFATIPLPNNAMLVIFFNSKRILNNFERSIVTSLSEIIGTTIKEVMQTTLINNLRETFFSTLAHDLQVPLIAERNAINYLLKKNKNSDDEKSKEILYNLKETNRETENMLQALSEIYAYETQRKELNKTICNFNDIIEEVSSKAALQFEEKNIVLKKNFESKKPLFFGDKIEISKVLLIFLLYAADHCEENSEISITVLDLNKCLQCCIDGKTENINDALNRIIFEKNLINNSIEQKIGEGIYLYLAKLIINRHNGRVYINQNISKGSILCIELEKPFS